MNYESTNQLEPEQDIERLCALLDAYDRDQMSVHPDEIVDALLALVLSLRDYPKSSWEWRWVRSVFPKPSELPSNVLDVAAIGFAEQHAGVIRGGIRKVLKDSIDLMDDQPEVAAADCWNRVVTRIRKALPALCQPGTAAMSTRVFSLSVFQALGWRKERLRQRDKCVPTIAVGISALSNDTFLEKLGKELAQDDIDRQVAETAIASNPAKVLRMYCAPCGQVSDVVSESGALYTLDCSHSRTA
jgi:hypothetical protein